MNADRQYYSTFSGRGALVPEMKVILREIDAGRDLDLVRAAVVEGRLVDRATRQMRENVWSAVSRRYTADRDPDGVRLLARMVARCPNAAAVDLVLFYEYCQIDTLLYDLTACCAYDLYQGARTGIDKVDVNEWLLLRETDHPEIATWSPQTRGRLLGSYLTIIRDFGLVRGANRKEFHKFYVPREAFVYALYQQKDRGIGGRALIQSTDWRLFLLSEEEVLFMLEDAERGGFVHFRRAGDIYDLRFVYEDLSEVVHVITA